MSRVLLISANDLKEWTPISGNVDKDKFLNYIAYVQSSDLRTYLGTDLLNSIYQKVIDSTLTGDYLTLVQDYIKPWLTNATANRFIKQYGVNAGNAGPSQNIPDNANIVGGLELAKECQNRSDHYGKLLTEYLQDNESLFVEYKKKDTTNQSDWNGWMFEERYQCKGH